MDNDGSLIVQEWRHVNSKPIPLVPEVFSAEVSRMAWLRLCSDGRYKGALSFWAGGPALFSEFNPHFDERPKNLPGWLSVACSIHFTFVIKWFTDIRFLRSPWESGPDLVQVLLIPPKKHQREWNPHDEDEALKRLAASSEEVSAETLYMKAIRSRFGRFVVSFPPPYANMFAYGCEWFNINHPFTREVVRLWAIGEVAWREGRLTPAQLGAIKDVDVIFKGDYRSMRADNRFLKDTQAGIDKVFERFTEFGLLRKSEPKILLPGANEFVPGTFIDGPRERMYFDSASKPVERRFGQPLK
jgi:hypothetical protein